MKILSFIFVLLCFSKVSALDINQLGDEKDYNQIYSRIIDGKTLSIDYQSPFFLKALSEAYEGGQLQLIKLKKIYIKFISNKSLEDKIMASWTFRNAMPNEWQESEKAIQNYTGQDVRILHLKNREGFNLRVSREDLAKDLMQDQPNMGVLRLYMFCRNERQYPCLFVARGLDGELVIENRQIWSQPSLGFSRHGKLFNEFNGNTPSGVFYIQGVMPYANGQDSFGKFRRLMLEFVEPSKSENELLKLLPTSSFSEDWWQESVVARDMGRSLFRIHGTGQEAPMGEPYYPFFGTSGCIAQRENTYDGIEYIDQRKLLDRLMMSLNMSPIYENETKIEALLYVLNINDEKKAVTLQELKDLNIL